MRTLKLQVQISADGFVGGPNGEMDWLNFSWDEALIQYVQTQLTDNIGTIVMGRKLAEGFIPHWASKTSSSDAGEAAAARIFTDSPKIVFSHTLTESLWDGVEISQTPLAERVRELKNTGTGDILAYGGASFVASLVKEGLVDEYHLFVNPCFVGKGLPITNLLDKAQQLQLKHSQAFSCGIVVSCYEPLQHT